MKMKRNNSLKALFLKKALKKYGLSSTYKCNFLGADNKQ